MNKFENLLLLALWLLVATAHAGTVTYVYTDPQGTPLAEANASGTITARFDYAPYGQSVTSMGAAPNGPGYTGHVNDPDTGLVYMQARYYDPEVGRFLSVDPVTPTAGNAFNFGRYTYGNNDPIQNIDPDGRESACVSIKVDCLGNNPASKGANTAAANVLLGFAKSMANAAGDAMGLISRPEGQPLQASNPQQATGMVLGAIAVNAATAVLTEDRSVVSNPIPKVFARVVPGELEVSTLGPPSVSDVFVTNANDIKGLDAQGISQKLTIPISSSGYNVIEFPSAGVNGIASPVNRSNPGFVGQGRTLGGASEFVIPNGPVPSNAVSRNVQ